MNEIETFVIPKNKKVAKKLKKTGFIISFMIYPLILFAIFYVAVNFNSILMSFQSINLRGEKSFVGFQNFSDFLTGIFSNGEELSYCLTNSLKLYAINLVVSVPLYIIFSYLVYKKCFGHRVFRILIMMPQIISGFVVCLLFKEFIAGTNAPLTKMFESMGIFDELGDGLQLLTSYEGKYAFATTLFYGIWISFGTNLVVYPNAMKEINTEIIESSKLDGVSNMWQDLRYIILPLIFPTFSTLLITGLAGIFSNEGNLLAFYPATSYTPNVVKNMGYFYNIQVINANETLYPQLAAGGLIMTIVVAPLTLLLKWALEKFGPSTEA